LFKKSTTGTIACLLLSFSLFGFPIQSTVPFLLNTDSNPINIAFRAFLLAVSLFLIFPHLFARVKKINLGWICFVAFWMVYSIRLIYDLEIKKIVFLDTNSFYIYSFAFGSCLVPSIAVFLNARYIKIQLFARAVLIILLVANCCLAYDILSFNNWNIAQVLISRAWVAVEVNGESKFIVNAITVSYYGALLAIVCIHFLRLGLLLKGWQKIMLSAGMAVGVFNLIIGASRGPMIIFFLLLLVELIIMEYNRFSWLKVIKFVFISLLILSALTFTILKFFNTEDVQLFARLEESFNTIQSNEKEERNFEWASAWNQFKRSPIVGDKFTNDYDHSYAHNIVLDIMMSTGIAGLSIFVLLFRFLWPRLTFLVKAINTTPELSIIFLLFIGECSIVMLSGGTFAAINFWLWISLILGLRFEYTKAPSLTYALS
jgi:O-antigen ligase